MCKSIRWFEDNRPELYKAVQAYEELQSVIVEGQVKTGKRELALIETKRRQGVGGQGLSEFMYITSLNKKDCQPQHTEMESYGIKSFVLRTPEDVDNIANEFVVPHLEKDDNLLTIYIDEGDYGSDKDQLLQKFFLRITEDIYQIEKSSGVRKKIRLRFYTATPEELVFSKYAFECCEHFYVPPASNYRGAEWLLDKNLVFESKPFFEFDANKNIILSSQALEMLHGWNQSEFYKPFSIVRVSGKNKDLPKFNDICKDIKLRRHLENQFNVKIVEVDENKPLVWGDYESDGKRHILEYANESFKIIFLINQTCTRSTEIKCHPLIYAFHDHRSSKTTCYSTQVQSSLRIAHYEYTGKFEYGVKTLWTDNPNGDGKTVVPINSDIILYSNVNCIMLHAKKINYEDFLSKEPTKKLSSRTSKLVYFKPTDDMINARNLKFIDIPKHVLSKALAEYDPRKSKQQYPAIREWLQKGRDKGAIAIREEFSRSYSKIARRNEIFSRALGANQAVSIAKGLIYSTHHTAIAPIFIDRSHPLYKEDFEELLNKNPGCLHKMAMMILSDEEIEARENHVKNQWCTKNRSMYNAKILQEIT